MLNKPEYSFKNFIRPAHCLEYCTYIDSEPSSDKIWLFYLFLNKLYHCSIIYY